MNFLLKIVEGPNKGAEIALVSGVAITLGKGDDCDIVLADPTLPTAPISLEPSDGGVTADGETLEPFVVKTVGATSFAIGPADEPWSELKWPEKAESQKPKAESGESKDESREGRESKETPSVPPAESRDDGKPKHRRRGGCGCLVALALLILALACLGWFFRVQIMDFCKAKGYDFSSLTESFDRSEKTNSVEKLTLAAVAARYGLSFEESDGIAKLTGNLKTRAARLRATAEAYEARPGVELDISDDESFRIAADDALFTLTEGALKVVSATNRMLSIGGVARSAVALRRTLEALDADLPKLRGVDVAGVVFGKIARRGAKEMEQEDTTPPSNVTRLTSKKKATSPSLPVCGILTKPYPCLVMRDGTRVLEGAPLGENVILKIDADEVTVTNSTGRFTWKP